MIGDLHCHTRFSDGSLSVDDLVFYAKRAGLDFVAVTDHDTMSGISRAELLGKRYGIGVIGGVEVSAWDYKRQRRVHLLCYLPANPDRLEGMLKHTIEDRDKCIRESLKKVMQLFPVTEEHVSRFMKGAPALYNVHIMLALMDLGYADCIYGDLFQELLSPKRGSCFVPRTYIDVLEAVQIIKSAGGICVLAHPSVYDSIEIMRELAQAQAIDGIEQFHPRNKDEDAQAIADIIREYDLIPTGGTDFHGAHTKIPHPIGTCVTQKASLERLFKLSKARQ